MRAKIEEPRSLDCGALWRRGPLYQYFAGLDRCDQATFIIITALAFAIGVSFSALLLSREPATVSAPLLTAPPFLMDFAATAAGQRA